MQSTPQTIVIDSKPECDLLIGAIQNWLGPTQELYQTDRIFKDLMDQIVAGLVADGKSYAAYVQGIPCYRYYEDVAAVKSTDTTNLTNAVRTAAMQIYFKLFRLYGHQLADVEILPNRATTNSLFLDLYQS